MTPLLVLLGTIAGAWYLLIVRPQKEQQTRHGRLVERLQVGDHVLTVGGIYGRVVAIEQATVVLELAPGLTSRIATDGIARIVHGGEAAIPTHAAQGGASAPSISPQAMDTDMHEQQHTPQPQPQAQFAPAPVLAQQQFGAQPAAPHPQMQPQMQVPVHLHAQPQPVYAAAPVPAPAPIAPIAPAPTHEPRPWGDVQPLGAPDVQPQPVHYAPQQQPYHPAPVQQYQQPVQHPVDLPSPPPMPLFVPFAQRQQVAPAQPAYQPVAATEQMPVIQHQPVHVPQQQPVLQPAHLAQHTAPREAQAQQQQAQPQQAQDTRRHSRAPKGMGSSLRLDDPTLRDTIARAREERSDLADEYRRLTAPLVDVGPPQQAHGAPVEPQFVGHDVNGVPLFATPGVPGVHPLEQYPAPAQITAMPRPNVAGPATVDPALQTNAFQRPAPYAPQVPETANPHVVQPAVQSAPTHA